MYAVCRLSGYQFRAEEGEVLRVPRQQAEAGATLDIDEVLLVNTGEASMIGTPTVDGAKVEAEVISHGKDDKVVVYKFKRRTKYRNTRGHRQNFTEVKIKKIVAP